MLKQTETSTNKQIDLNDNELLYAKDIGDGITLATLKNKDGNVETCVTNFSSLWQSLLNSREFVQELDMIGYEHTQEELLQRLEVLHIILRTWSRVALVLGVTEKTVYVWKSGSSSIPNYVWYVSKYFETIDSAMKTSKKL